MKLIHFFCKMNKCKGVTLQGKSCNRTCKEGIEFCGYHSKSKTVQINKQPVAVKQSIILTFSQSSFVVEPHMLVKLQGSRKGSRIIDLNKKLLQFDDRRTEIATVLVLPNYANNNLYQTLLAIDWDKKILLRNKVVNRVGKYAISIDDTGKEPNYEENKYRVIAYDDVEEVRDLKDNLSKIFKQDRLSCKGEYNYNHEKLKLKYQGAKVNNMMCIHLGDPIQMSFKWYFANKPASDSMEFTLNHGDLYIMSEKATGHDYKLKKNPILKHGYTI